MATRPIDEKIVAMKMDNSDFKNKAMETTSIFGKLRQSLSNISTSGLEKTTQSLGNIRTAAHNIDMSSLARNVETVASRFSNLGIVATTALMNITNRAVDAGLALYKSLTVDPLADGFREYENKMSSIGTMLANTEWAGSTLDDVKKTLGELNDYADNTIYSFEQMTANIGRFTAAGVTLEDSATAIKGLGNLAAVSGSNVDQLNTVMYQMSQALAAGKLNLMDWNSLVNGGMAGKKTQDALVATAKAMGKNVDLSDGFRASIEQGWLTSEVFLETLKKFGNDQSMTKAATSVRTFTGFIGALKESVGSGWAETWELIFGDFEVATKRWTAVSQVVGGFFEKSTHARNAFIKSLADGGVFQAFFDIFINSGSAVLKVLDAISGGLKKAFPPANVETLKSLAGAIKDFVIWLKPSEETLSNISTLFQALGSVLYTIVFVILRVGKALIDMIPPDLGTTLLGFIAKIAKMVIAFSESVRAGEDVGKSFSGLEGVFSAVGKVVNSVVNGFKDLGLAISDVWKSISNSSLVQYLKEIDFSLTPIIDGFKSFIDHVGSGFEWIGDKAVAIKEALANMIPSGDKVLAGGFIAGLVAVVGMVMKLAWDLFEVFTGWGKIGAGVTDVLESVSGALNAFTASIYANALLTIAIAIGVLAVSLKLLSTLNGQQIANGLYAVVGSMTALVGAMAIMSKYDITGGGMSTAVQIVALSVAFAIMAGALKKVADLSWGDISKGIVGLSGTMGALAGAIAIMGKFGGPQVGASALQIIAIAGAIHIMLSAIEKISKISTGSLVKGTITIGIVLTQLSIFMRSVSGTKFGIGATLGMLAVGQAIKNITDAINEIAKIDTKNLITGLVTIGLILTQITLFANLTSDMGLLSAGAGMLLVAGALTALIIPIKALGNMSMGELAKGLGAIAVALGAIAAASMFMTGMVAAGVGIALIAGALTLLLIPIGAFAAMSWTALLAGMIGLGGSLAVMGGAALLLAPAIPLLGAFGGGVALLGLGLLAAGAGLTLFSGALLALAGMTSAAITTIVATLGTLIVGLASLIPSAVDFLTKLISQLIKSMGELTPQLVDAVVKIVLELLKTIARYLPDFIDTGVKIVTSFLDGIARNMPKIVDSAHNLIMTYIKAMTDVIKNKGPEMVGAMRELMGEVLIVVIKAGLSMIDALFGWIPGVKDATAKVGKTAEETIRKNFKAEDAGTEKGEEFSAALDATSSAAKTAGQAIANAGKAGAESIDMTQSGTNFGTGFANGISGMVESVKETAKSLAKAAKDKIEEFLDINSPSRVMTTIGEHTGQGFANGIANKKKEAAEASKALAQAATRSFNSAMSELRTDFRLGDISASRYVTEIEKIKKEYSNYKELVKSANEEIKKVESGAAKYRQALREQQADDYKEWMDERKYYNELSLMEELDIQQKIVNSYKKGTAERAEADRELYRIKNEINNQLISANEDYVTKIADANQRLIDGERALNEEYDKAVADRTKTLVGFAGLFDAINTEIEVTGQDLINNLQGQVNTFASWASNIQELANKGIDQGLLEELKQMGPQAAAQIAALNTLTAEQLAQYSSLWQQKNELARTQAIAELEGLRADTENQIKELRAKTAVELETYRVEWINKIKQIRTGTTDQFVGLNTSMKQIGVDTMKGLQDGLSSMTPALMAQAKSIADSIAATIKKALEIKSPSRVTMGLGEYAGEGLAIGLANKAKQVASNAKNLALTAKDSLNSFLDGFEIPEDNELRFKAVIDYEGFDPGGFGIRPIRIVPDTSFTNGSIEAVMAINRQNADNNSKTMDVAQPNESKSTVITQHLNFHSQQLTPSEVARKNLQASKQLAMQWGV